MHIGRFGAAGLVSCVSVVSLVSGGLAVSSAHAQPADRSAAFAGAIAAAEALQPMIPFYEADVENDDGEWVIDVKLATTNGLTIYEYEFDAITLALRSVEIEPAGPGKAAEIQAWLALLPQAQISPARAIELALPRTPNNKALDSIEREIENARLVYEFKYFPVGSNSNDDDGGNRAAKLYVDAITGVVRSPGDAGPGGGGNPPPQGSITILQAIEIATAARPGLVIEADFESDDNQWKVKVLDTSVTPFVLYEVRIDAMTGDVVEIEIKPRSREDRARDRVTRIALARVNLSAAQLAGIVAGLPLDGARPSGLEFEFEDGRLIAMAEVSDDNAPRVIRIDASSGLPIDAAPQPAAPDPTPVGAITPASAVTLAEQATPGSIGIEVELELEAGRSFYKVLTATSPPTRIRETTVDARTGRVWGTTQIPASNQFLAQVNQILARRAGVSLTFAQAQTRALNLVGGASVNAIVEKMELEPEDGSLTYDVDVRVGTETFELEVPATTGRASPR